MAVKEKQIFKQQLSAEFEAKHAALTGRLDAKIAEVAQLKSIQNVRLKKLNEQKVELETKLSKELKQVQVHSLNQQIDKR